jgi:hypothetical protein
MMRATLPALIGGTLLLSLGLSWCRVARVPADSDLDAAAAHVRRVYRAGDLILVEPHTQVGPRRRLGDLPLREPRSLAVADLVGIDRIHLVETGAVGSDQISRSVLAVHGTATGEAAFGQVRVTTFDLEAREVLFDLAAAVAQLTVIASYPDGDVRACERFADRRWTCPRDPDWSWVGPTIRAMDDQPRECVWMHPLRAGGVLRIELPPITLDGDAEVVAHFGFTLDAARRAAAPVDVRLLAGDELLVQQRFPVQPGWVPLRAPLAREATQPLALELRTRNNGAAHFCGALRVVGGGS